MDSSFFITLTLTFKVATITTIALLSLAIPLGYFLAFNKSKFTPILEAIVSMPLVLPPSVLGFYLLITFSPQSFVGKFFFFFFILKLVFSCVGLIVGLMIFSLPFMFSSF